MARSIERELPYLHADCELKLEHLQQAIDLQRHLGAIKAPIAAADMVDLGFLPLAAASA
jgi:hypothetical protein